MIAFIIISLLIQAVLYLLADRTRVPFLKLVLLLLIIPANILFLMPAFVLGHPFGPGDSFEGTEEGPRCGLPALGMLFFASFLAVFIHTSFHIVYNLIRMTLWRFREDVKDP